MNWRRGIIATLLGTVTFFLAVSCGSSSNGEGEDYNSDISSYTVTFVLNGGSSINEHQNVPINGFIIEPEPVRTGYIFGGWFYNANLTDSMIKFPYLITSDITLYARWVPQPGFTVTFDSDGGTNIPPRIGVAYIASEPIPQKDANEFIGWLVDTQNVSFPYAVTRDIILYAFYSPKEGCIN